MLRSFRGPALVTRPASGVLPLLAAVFAVLAVAGPVRAAERATLTWDTDATDVDLHIWDSAGNHAWFGGQENIPNAALSTDIIYGFGPEHFEEFTGSTGRTYAYGICYYGSNTDDGSVPETVATVTLADPNGQLRTLKRTLRHEKEAYYLGSSPQGPAYVPANNWCSTGPYRPASDAGPPDDVVSGGSGSFEGCPRVRRRIGVVELCANEFVGGGPIYTARGNVRVNGSVYVGEGPVTVDVDDRTISAPTGTIQVVRGGQPIAVAGGDVLIDGDAVSDPVSGRDQLASVRVAQPRADLQALNVGGLPLNVTSFAPDALNLYLDRREGGGIISAAQLKLPFAGDQLSANALAVGVHAGSVSAVRALGGTAAFGAVKLPGGWGLSDFTLGYQDAGNTWNAAGGLTTPFFGLDLTGTFADGQLDAVGVTVSREVPIGATGFILRKVGGRVQGLAKPPLRITASAAGKWGSVPNLNAAILMLNGVSLNVDLSGSASIRGDVTFLREPPAPITGSIDIGFAISPFRATGRLKARADVGPIDVSAGGGIVVRTDAFTAAGGAEGTLRGVTLGAGRGVLSNKGIGVTGQLCFFHACSTVGAGMNWQDFPSVRWVGADVEQFVTASGVHAAPSAFARSILVSRGRPFLFVDADGPDGTQPAFTLRSPRGRIYTTGSAKADSRIVKDGAIGYTGLTIASPQPGRWTVTPAGSARSATRFVSQAIRRIKRVRITSLAPRGSRRTPLSRRTGAGVRVSWSSRGLSANAKVNVYVTPNPGQLGTFVTGGKRARGGDVRVPRKLLRKGVNRIRLVVVDNGIAIDDVVARGVIRAK